MKENHGFSQAHANALLRYRRGSQSARRFQTMLKLDGQDIFGVRVLTCHILMAPWSKAVLDESGPRLTDYKLNKKTIQVPVDWKPDAPLLRDMAAARIAEIRG